ncbi:putative mediator of RNA polymerase II transcription [Podospora australis]|uniref:Mediator of RNA polymerase II transcription subunit 12 n=1 Tax=Podospora australis TaxID=1536484 RepID=A0AAN6X3F7_9PEZI|nr:putative mediator of RNA polymerase II transcription [Podospora australis]
MTSRPPLGVQQRPAPPQRTLSGPNLSQRPGAHHQRALSSQQQQQHHLPQSPIRKEATFHEYAPSVDPNDGAPSRFPSLPRGGSRLRLELSHDDAMVKSTITETNIIESPNLIESSNPLTPSRVVPPIDPSEHDEMMSPGLQQATADSNAPIPFPPRRQRIIPAPTVRDVPAPTPKPSTAKKDMPPKPYKVEVPAAAPRYYVPGKASETRRAAGNVMGGSLGPPATPPAIGYCDFFPWSGKHPEDKFSENVIRQGYFDKHGFNPDTQSAKATLFPAIRGNKSGLNALSTLFTAMLGHRRHTGQITASSTFRPPPRVTVTDTKRELWLKELANTSTPLRKLSRTIPHGIRGQVLLDQCLNKRIPFERALWLIKCVGVNELRTCKRKGVSTALAVGAEARWIKDWTNCIQKFVESVLFSFEDPDWKPKVRYAILLSSHLFEQQLLDREPYMEWLVSNFEGSNQHRLPMWMLILEIYWKDLLKLRRYGRRLVTALVAHHHLVYSNPDKDILQPLLDKLTLMLNKLVMRTPDNFVSPSVWFKYRDTIKQCLPAGDEAHVQAFAAIASRNEQLVASANRSQPAARHILVQWLDRTLQSPMPEELPKRCWDISGDKSALARALLEWCTSLYRPGKTKVYVTSQILQQWNARGLDTTAEILDFLDADTCVEKERKDHLYHVVCELVRSGIFVVPRYAQWLIARGGLTNPDDVLPDGPAPARLLAELPTSALSERHQTLRGGMLRRAAYHVEDEARDSEMAIQHLRHSLGLPIDPADPMAQRKPRSINKLSKQINISGRALKAEVGRWLRDSIAASASVAASAKGKEVARGPDISLSMFGNVRRILEAAEDLSMLADIVRILTDTRSVEVLTAMCNTVTRHFFVFSALGVSKRLFADLYKRLRIIHKEQGPTTRPLLASLASLAPRIAGMEQLALQLKRDLAQSDRQNPVDACSPVSDNMIARLQDDSNDIHEEIEKLLAAGTSVDKNAMDNLFHTIVQRVQTAWGQSGEKQRAYSLLLVRLRVFDAVRFDTLMAKWLLYVRTIGNRPSILRIYPLLMSVGCLHIRTIFQTTQDQAARTPGAGGNNWPQVVQLTCRKRYLQEVLQLIMSPLPHDYDLITPEENYRFTNLQEQVFRENPKEIVNLVGLAMAEYSFARAQNDVESLPLDDPDAQKQLSTLIKLLVLKDAAGVGRALATWVGRSHDAHVGSWIDEMTTQLLMPTADKKTNVTFDEVLELTNEFTWPFCQVQLILSSSASNDPNNQQAADRQQSHLDLLTDAMDRAIDKKNITWVGIVHSLSVEVTQHLKSRAQSRFLGLLPSPREPPSADVVPEQTLQTAENLLSVIEALMRGSPPGTRQPQLVPDVVARLVDLWELLAMPDFDAKHVVLSKWLPLALNFITLHAQTFDNSKPSGEIRAKLLIVCAGLIQELDALHSPGMHTRHLSSRIFDLSCLLSDNLPEESRLLCLRAVRDTAAAADPRLRYVFSYTPPHPENLFFSQREKVPMPVAVGIQQPGAAAVSSAAGAAPRVATATAGGGAGGGTGAQGGAVGGANNAPTFGAMFLGTPPSLYGEQKQGTERLTPFTVRKWDIVNVPTQSSGENDTSLSLGLFEARGPKVFK